MPTIIPTGFCEAQIGITSEINSHVSSISIGFQCTTEEADIINLLGVLNGALPDMAQDMALGYTMTSVRLTFPDGLGGEGSITLPLADDIEGATAGNVMDVRNAFVVNKATNLLGRKGRGRFYLPGPTEERVTPAGTFDLEWQTSMNNHLSSFLDKLLNPDDPLEAQQPYLLHTDDELAPSPISVMILSPLVGRIRRRAA